MRKKIFDITPPGKKSGELPAVKTAKLEMAASVQKTVSGGKKLMPFFLGMALLLGGALSYFLIPPKIKIEIWPEQKVIEESIVASVSAGQDGENRIAGQIVKEEKTVSQSFPATGTKLKSVKARGVIRVYNGYSTVSQPLLAATRFVSDDGKLFRTPIRVVIPGGRYEGEKLVPGFSDIQVIADQPGEDYNIDPSTFSIPGFAGTQKYTAFYGKSSESMTGGLLKEVTQVTQADLDKAREILISKAASETKDILKNSLSSQGYAVLDQALFGQSADFGSEAEAGRELEVFTAQAKAAVSALVFKESDLRDFALNYLKGKMLPEEKLIDSFFSVKYLLESADLAKPELSLKLSIAAKSYSIPEDSRIKEMIKSKSAQDIENVIKNTSGIGKAKVDLWPFWVKLAPDDLKSITLVLHLGVD